MNARLFKRVMAVGLLSMVAAACTMKSEEAPPLTGPSELGTAIVVTVTPDIIQQDGASQSVVTITARDINGQPIRNVPMRVEIMVDGIVADFGGLSARNVVTGADGRATVVYTAPRAAVGNEGVDDFTIVSILVTPVGTDFGNSVARMATIRLVPSGIVIPPSGLTPRFTFSPAVPAEGDRVLFDASSSLIGPGLSVSAVRWDFGDGRSGEGVTVVHQFNESGVFPVTLTLTDQFGRSVQTTQNVRVTPGAQPTGEFVISPTDPQPNQLVSFNAAAVVPPPGRRFVSFEWDFGDGSPRETGSTVTHRYTREGTFVVTLVLVDDLGRQFVRTRSVQVAFPDTGITGTTTIKR